MPDLTSVPLSCTQCDQEIPAPIENSTPIRTLAGAPRLLMILDLTDLHAHLLTHRTTSDVASHPR